MLEKMDMGSKSYLDYKTLSAKAHIKRICRLHSYNIKANQETQTTYVILRLRDRNDVHVMGTIFNIDDADQVSIQLKKLKGNVVEVTGVVSIFGDRYTLQISNVDQLTPIFDKESEKVFSRSIENLDELTAEMTAIYSQLGIEVRPSLIWEFSSVDEVYDGKSGGLVKLMNNIVRSSTAYVTANGIDRKLFAKCLYVSLEMLGHKLSLESQVGFRDNLTLFEKIREYNDPGMFDSVTYPVAFDCMSSIVGMTEPVHPYSVIIKKLIDSSMEIQKIVTAVPTMVLGDTINVGGTKLSAF